MSILKSNLSVTSDIFLKNKIEGKLFLRFSSNFCGIWTRNLHRENI